MQCKKNIEFIGTYDYKDWETITKDNWSASFKTFSIPIFKWELKSNGKEMKRGKVLLRIKGLVSNKEEAFRIADNIVAYLNSNLNQKIIV